MKPVKDIVLTFFVFAFLTAFIKFLLLPETENKNRMSFFLHNFSTWNEKISSKLISFAIADISEKFEANEIDFTFKLVLLFVCFIKSQVKWSAKEEDPPLPHE